MSKEINRPPTTTQEVVDTLTDHESDFALNFPNLALAARRAREEGDNEAAEAIMSQLQEDLNYRAQENGWSDDEVSSRMDKYSKMADLEAPDSENLTPVSGELTAGSVVYTEDGKKWAVAMARKNERTGRMEYLISDATTKAEGLSHQRLATEDELYGKGGGSGLESLVEDDAARQGREIAERQLRRGLISQSHVGIVAKSHADRIRQEQKDEVVEPLENNPVEGEAIEPLENNPIDEEIIEPLENNPVEDGVIEPLENNPVESERSGERDHGSDIDTVVQAAKEVGGSLTRDEAEEILKNMRKNENSETVAETEDSPLERSLGEARSRYASETAKDRGRFWGRFLQSDSRFFSRFIKKIPGAQRLAGFVNEKLAKHEAMDEAREAYEKALGEGFTEAFSAMRDRVQQGAESRKAELLEKKDEYTEEEYNNLLAAIEREVSAEALRAKEISMSTAEEARLQAEILKYQQQYSGKATRFTNWWARQKGVTGALKKAATLAGAGVVVGATLAVGGTLIGVALPAGIGAAAGGAYGGWLGLRVNKRLANSLTSKGEGAQTVAQQRARKDSARYSEGLEKASSSAEYIIKNTERSTAEVVKGNRNRLKSAIGLTALGAGLGTWGARSIIDSFFPQTVGATEGPVVDRPGSGDALEPGANTGGGSEGTAGDGGTEMGGGETGGADGGDVDAGVTEPDPPAVEQEIQGLDFSVESGNGYTHELQDFARANEVDLSGDDAWRLHNDIMSRFGEDYIDINGPGGDIYRQASDVRLAEPGMARWKDGVAEFIMEWMNQRSL